MPIPKPVQNIQANGLEITEYTFSVPREDWVMTRKRRVKAKALRAGRRTRKNRSNGVSAQEPSGIGTAARRPWNNIQASRVIISQKTLRATGAVASTRLVLGLTPVLSLM